MRVEGSASREGVRLEKEIVEECEQRRSTSREKMSRQGVNGE